MVRVVKLFSFLCFVFLLHACKKDTASLRGATLVVDKPFPKTGDKLIFTLQADVVYKGKQIQPDEIIWNVRDVRDNPFQPESENGMSMTLNPPENGTYAVEVLAKYPNELAVRRNIEAEVTQSLEYVRANLPASYAGSFRAWNGKSWLSDFTIYSDQTFSSFYLYNTPIPPSGNGRTFYFANDFNISSRNLIINQVLDDGSGQGYINLQDTLGFQIKQYPIKGLQFSAKGRQLFFTVFNINNSAEYIQCTLTKK